MLPSGMGALRTVLALLTCLASPPAHSQASAPPVSGAVPVPGYKVPLPDGSWGVAYEERLPRDTAVRIVLARREGARISALLAFDDELISAMLDTGERVPVIMPNPKVCTDGTALDAVVIPDLDSAGESDCVVVRAGPPDEMRVPGNPVGAPPYGPVLTAAGWHLSATFVSVTMISNRPSHAFQARAWFDPTASGLPAEAPAAWAPGAVARDRAKQDYIRRAAAWGNVWRRALVATRAGKLTDPVTAMP